MKRFFCCIVCIVIVSFDAGSAFVRISGIMQFKLLLLFFLRDENEYTIRLFQSRDA